MGKKKLDEAQKKGRLILTGKGVNLVLGEDENELLQTIKKNLRSPSPKRPEDFHPPGGQPGMWNSGGAGDR